MAVLDILHLPLQNHSPCSSTQPHVLGGCIKGPQFSGFLSSLAKGKHHQKLEGKEEYELKDVAVFLLQSPLLQGA